MSLARRGQTRQGCAHTVHSSVHLAGAVQGAIAQASRQPRQSPYHLGYYTVPRSIYSGWLERTPGSGRVAPWPLRPTYPERPCTQDPALARKHRPQARLPRRSPTKATLASGRPTLSVTDEYAIHLSFVTSAHTYPQIISFQILASFFDIRSHALFVN